MDIIYIVCIVILIIISSIGYSLAYQNYNENQELIKNQENDIEKLDCIKNDGIWINVDNKCEENGQKNLLQMGEYLRSLGPPNEKLPEIKKCVIDKNGIWINNKNECNTNINQWEIDQFSDNKNTITKVFDCFRNDGIFTKYISIPGTDNVRPDPNGECLNDIKQLDLLNMRHYYKKNNAIIPFERTLTVI